MSKVAQAATLAVGHLSAIQPYGHHVLGRTPDTLDNGIAGFQQVALFEWLKGFKLKGFMSYRKPSFTRLVVPFP